jgi:chromosome segregation protein
VAADEQLATAKAALAAATGRIAEIENQLTTHRVRREELAEAVSAGHRELAALEARLASLEELDVRRATFADAARYVLGELAGLVRQHGAVADYLDVERSYERAVDALLGDLLQHILVDTDEDVQDALARLSEANAGRCGFVVLQHAPKLNVETDVVSVPAGARSLKDVVRTSGAHADTVGRLLGNALIVDTVDAARPLAASSSLPVATMGGEVFRGPVIVEGGTQRDARGILEMRGDIDQLRAQLKTRNVEVHHLANELFGLDLAINGAESELAARRADQHTQEKIIVGLEGQIAHENQEVGRLERRLQVVDTERRRATEEEQAAEMRREQAAAAIADYESQQRDAEGKLGIVNTALMSARDDAEGRMRLVTDARTEQAGLTERTAAVESEIAHLEENARELDERTRAREQEIEQTNVRRVELRSAVAEGERVLDADILSLEDLRQKVRAADESVSADRMKFSEREHEIRAARHALENVRSQVMQSEVARATAASDLGHLAASCLEAVNLTIGDVVAEVARMERDGELVAPGKRLAALAVPDEDESADAEAAETPGETAGAGEVLNGPDDVIADLRRKIERVGPVNMMAIEQFDELDTRHTFLTSQRKDLLDSIAQTGDAIRKIDKTTRERFEEAFATVNANFEQTFTTLFGGGRAGLVLIDQENDPESGIDIIAQPPGKRLQNVQLLSGGEKALTAMALMFAIFKYRPSPFCLLDEIDAPLDDANIGRFVEMLQGMQEHTQFILITHNRKTMEIANRLYGVTMEEPGVSKLISLQLN